MNGNTFGRIFRVTTWGESHGTAIGLVIDGCPAGIELAPEDFVPDMQLRQGGKTSFTTARREQDRVHIESGVFRGKTLGTPIALRIENNNVNSNDYEQFEHQPRPGHADITTHWKHGVHDFRGGGRSSARETATRVAAGVVAKKVLVRIGVEVFAYLSEIGKSHIPPLEADIRHADCETLCSQISHLRKVRDSNLLRSLSADESAALAFVEDAKERGDSLGGAVTSVAFNLPRGLGEPVFDKYNASLSHAFFSLPAVVSVEIGGGRAMAKLPGSKIRDAIQFSENGNIRFASNHHGGLLGGMTSGTPLWSKIWFHAPTSIPEPIATINWASQENVEVSVRGRHDAFPLPRVIPVVEAMQAITTLDAALVQGVSLFK